MSTDEQQLTIAADLDGITPDLLPLLDALTRQVNRRAEALRQVVESRLADQRTAIIAEYADRIRELEAADRLQQDRIADLEATVLQMQRCIAELEHRANDAQRAGNVVATWSHTIDDLLHALVFAQAKASRPQPSAEWRIYRYADCPMCGVWRSRIPMRFLDDVWWLDCPQCGE